MFTFNSFIWLDLMKAGASALLNSRQLHWELPILEYVTNLEISGNVFPPTEFYHKILAKGPSFQPEEDQLGVVGQQSPTPRC